MRNAAKFPAPAAANPTAKPANLIAQRGGKGEQQPENLTTADTSPTVEAKPTGQMTAPTVNQVETPAPALVVEAPTVKPAETPAPAPVAVPVAEPKHLTVPEVLNRARRVVHLTEKVTQIETQLGNLEAFKLGTTENRDTLIIQSGEGRKFETFKTPLVQKAMDVLLAEIGAALLDTTNELRILMNA